MAFPIVLVVMAGLTAAQQMNAAKQKEIEFEQQAEEEEFQAKSEELKRRERLNKILAANAVAGQTSGIKTEGTPASISLASAREASLSEQVTGASKRMRQRALSVAGQNAVKSGRLQAASTLLSAGQTIAKAG